jgi:acyl-CoA reductase-like NAD-dependent aldehyde dehydrogenase
VSLVAPIIAGGNTCIVLASESKPLCAITFAEVLNSSDVPSGVVNVLTGSQKEMIGPLTTHMDVNAMSYSGKSKNFEKQLKESSALNLKRVSIYSRDWIKSKNQDLYMIADFQEIKTTWHPIENIGGSSSLY